MSDGWNGHGWGGGGWLAMALLMVLFWGTIVAIVVTISRRSHGEPPPVPGNNALHVLDERFARGEIDVEEYHTRRNILKPR